LFTGSRTREQLSQLPTALRLRIAARDLSDGFEGSIYVGQGQSGDLRRRRHLAHRRVANADLALAELARQIRDGDGGLAGFQPPQQLGQALDFGGP
jgi:hypothetical protein